MLQWREKITTSIGLYEWIEAKRRKIKWRKVKERKKIPLAAYHFKRFNFKGTLKANLLDKPLTTGSDTKTG